MWAMRIAGGLLRLGDWGFSVSVSEASLAQVGCGFILRVLGDTTIGRVN